MYSFPPEKEYQAALKVLNLNPNCYSGGEVRDLHSYLKNLLTREQYEQELFEAACVVIQHLDAYRWEDCLFDAQFENYDY